MSKLSALAGALLGVGALLLLAGNASAVPIVHVNPGNNTIATAIDDLEVTSEGETRLFDVVFVCLTFTEFQAGGGALIYDGALPNSAEAWAEAVQAAIVEALNAYNDAIEPDVVVAGVNGAESSDVTRLPFADGAAMGSVSVERSVYTGTEWATAADIDVSAEEEAVYVGLALVPEPSTALLLASGLLGGSLLLRARRLRAA